MKNFVKRNSLLGIILLGLMLLLLFGFRKEGFFIDELYSFGLSNAQYKTDIADYDIYHKNIDMTTENPFSDYLTVDKEHRFDYAAVIYNQIRDVHPPLYYMLLHTICSFFPGTLSKWYGIAINLFFYVGIIILMYRIGKEIFKQDEPVLISCLFYTISAANLNMGIYIRMYSMMTFFTLLYIYLHLYAKKNGENIWLFFGIGLTCILGSLTQYYFLILAFFISVGFCISLLKKKKILSLMLYAGIMVAALALAFAAFPHLISQLQGDNNSYAQTAFAEQNLIGKILINLIALFSFINYSFFAGYYPIFIFLFGLVFVHAISGWYKKKLKINFWGNEQEKNAFYLASCLVCATLMIGLASWIPAERYYYHLFPLYVLIVIYYTHKMIEIPSGRKLKEMLYYSFLSIYPLLALVVMIRSALYYNHMEENYIPYLYTDERVVIDAMQKEKRDSIILLTEENNPSVTQELYTFLHVDQVMISTKERMDEAISRIDSSVDNYLIIDTDKGMWGSGYDDYQIVEQMRRRGYKILPFYHKGLNTYYIVHKS